MIIPLDPLASVTSGLTRWWAPALAFAAGVVSFASPCVFPLVPGYLSFVSGGEAQEKRPVVPILMFILGFAAVFTLLGVSASAVRFAKSALGLRIAGAVVLVFGVVMLLYALRIGWPALYAERRPFLSRIRPGPAGAARTRTASSPAGDRIGRWDTAGATPMTTAAEPARRSAASARARTRRRA